ncbi:MAG: hypothetical protein JXR70_03285, partial [Spirochaetales bacterium]|nr:hypothetical protein [Spirochaetales bacterium]
IKRAVKHYNPDTAEGKEKIFQFLYPYVENLDSQIKLDGYLNTIADTIGVNYKAVKSDFHNRKTRKKPQTIVEENVQHPIIPTDELSLMLALAVNAGLYEKHRNQLSPDLLEDPNAKELYFTLEECFREDNYSNDYFMGLIERHQLKELLIEKFSTGEYTINTDDFITKGIYKLKKREIMRRQDQISVLIKRFEKNDPEKTKDLMVEKMILDKELQKLRVGDNV